MHKDYLEFIDAYYYLIVVAYFVNYLELEIKCRVETVKQFKYSKIWKFKKI
jgi:hypothetical protein